MEACQEQSCMGSCDVTNGAALGDPRESRAKSTAHTKALSLVASNTCSGQWAVDGPQVLAGFALGVREESDHG